MRKQVGTEIKIHAKDRSHGIAPTWDNALDQHARHRPSMGQS